LSVIYRPVCIVVCRSSPAVLAGDDRQVQLRAARDEADRQRARAEHQERFARHYLYAA
jgi:hypothetical protein